MPRSGTHYLYALLSAADNIEKGIGDYSYQERVGRTGTWKFELENRIPNNLRHLEEELRYNRLSKISNRAFVLSHYYSIREEALFDPLRMKCVVLIRHPVEASKSWYRFNYNKENKSTISRFLQNEAQHIINFCNYWGRALKEQEYDPLVIKYERLISNTTDEIEKINNYWGLSHKRESLNKASRLCEKERMMRKIPEEVRYKNKRVSKNRYINHFYIDKIKEKIKKEITFDFGYKI
jgi:hypothetical protein